MQTTPFKNSILRGADDLIKFYRDLSDQMLESFTDDKALFLRYQEKLYEIKKFCLQFDAGIRSYDKDVLYRIVEFICENEEDERLRAEMEANS